MISEPVLGIIMLCIMIFAIFIGFPVAFTLMALGVLFGFPSMGWTIFDLMVQRSFAVMNNDVPLWLSQNARGRISDRW